MEGASFSIRMEVAIKDSGKIIKWMGLADYTIKEENQHIKDNGHKINSMASEKSIMTILSPSILHSTIRILTSLKITGSFTKVCL